CSILAFGIDDPAVAFGGVAAVADREASVVGSRPASGAVRRPSRRTRRGVRCGVGVSPVRCSQRQTGVHPKRTGETSVPLLLSGSTSPFEYAQARRSCL